MPTTPKTARTLAALLLLPLGGAVVGCVPQDKYQAQRLRAEALDQRLTQSEISAKQSSAEAAAYKQQLDSMSASGGNMTGLVTNLQQQNAQLQSQLDDLNRRYAETVGKIGSGPALPVALSNELTQLADQNSDVITFDAKTGVVKFKSDVTFASGQTALQPKAKDTLDRVANILNGPQASGYELLVAGHTDSKPVSNPATIKAGNKNNMYLSAHRAISVAEAMVADGVNKARIGYVGYGDTRPVAANTTPAGMAANRRVEVLILPTRVSSDPLIGTDADPGTASPAKSTAAGGNKDGAATPEMTFQRPELNK